MNTSHTCFGQDKILAMAKAAYPEFVEAMHKATGSTIDKDSEPIIKNVFINGYISAHRDMARLFSGQVVTGVAVNQN